MSRGRALAAVVVAAACLAPPAVALDDGVRTPRERAAYASLPAVMRVTATIRVDRLADERGSVRVGRTVTLTGTGFGVGPNAVVTARHVVRPSAAALLAEVQRLGVRGAGRFDPNDVRVTSAVVHVTLERASARPDGTADRVTATVARLTPARSPADLALLRTAARQPALALDDGTTSGTQIAVVGFGTGTGREPGVRLGTIERAARQTGSTDESLVAIDVDAAPGDSGAPVLDAQGRVHGMLIRRAVAAGELSIMSRAGAIRSLAADAGLEIGPTAAASDFSAGMAAFWEHDYPTAASALRRTASQLPASAWIADQADRADALASARYEVVRDSPWRAPLIVAAIAALTAATVLAIRFWSLGDSDA